MRESTGRGPTVDLSEFERRLRGAEPASQSKADPLSELARLMDGEDEETSTERYGRVFAAPPAAARAEFTEFSEWLAQSGKPVAAEAAGSGAAKVDENALAAAFRGSLAPDAAEAGQALAQSRGPGAAFGGAYQDQGQPPPAPPRAAHQNTAPRPPAHQEPAYPAREYPETDPRGASPAGQARADGGGHASAHASNVGAPPPPAADGEWTEDSYGQDSYVQGSYGQGSYGQGSHGQGSHGYDDYGPEDDAGYPLEEPEPSRVPQWLRFKPWHVIAGVATLAVVSIGWGFAHRGGVDGPRDIATINAPDGPAKLPPAAGADPGGGQGAAVLDRNENAPVNKMVSHEEQAVDPKAAPYDPGPLASSEPKKVKTVSVRPDGSVIENEAVPPAVVKAARGGSNDSASKAAAGKSGGTPLSAAKPATTPRAEKTVGAAPAKPKTAPKVAAVEENAAPIDDNAAAAAPRKVSGGSFAVQFGAANTEADARALMTKIAGKYGSQLGGRRPTFKMAKVDGKTVYRVRVGGVSKESATGICEKIKSSGGACFIAGN